MYNITDCMGFEGFVASDVVSFYDAAAECEACDLILPEPKDKEELDTLIYFMKKEFHVKKKKHLPMIWLGIQYIEHEL